MDNNKSHEKKSLTEQEKKSITGQKMKSLTNDELSRRVKEAEEAGMLLCMTDCEVVKVSTKE